MKSIIFFMLSALCAVHSLQAQQYVLDRKYLTSVEANQAARSSAEETHNQYLKKINNNIKNLNTNVGSVVLAQTIIYNGLSNVNSALKDGLEVRYMATITADMISYLDQALTLGKSDPYLFLFASNIAVEMKARSLGLVIEVSSYVLKSGDNILADFNSRDQLLKKVTVTLQILDGLAYGAWRAMFWAKQRGIMATINPWQGYINNDKYFVEEIINNAKYLHQ
jgi:hypothetical protein